MKPGWLLVALVAGCGAARAADRTVIVPTGTRPFVVSPASIVRLSARGISGSRIEATVDGPARVQDVSRIVQMREGQILIGSLLKEFDLKPTGPGKVTVTITVTSPIPNTEPVVTQTEFEVRGQAGGTSQVRRARTLATRSGATRRL